MAVYDHEVREDGVVVLKIIDSLATKGEVSLPPDVEKKLLRLLAVRYDEQENGK